MLFLCCAADAAAAFVDEVFGTAKKQQVLAVDELWHGLRRAYPAELTAMPSAPSTACSWLPYGTSSSGSGDGGGNSAARRARRSRSPSASPAPPPRQRTPTREPPSRPGILFHCVHGTSRSACVLASVLLHRRLSTGGSWLGSTQLNSDTLGMELAPCSDWSYAAGVVKIVQLARPQVRPNDGFLQQLHEYHQELEQDERT